jgi:hypothetical protein
LGIALLMDVSCPTVSLEQEMDVFMRPLSSPGRTLYSLNKYGGRKKRFRRQRASVGKLVVAVGLAPRCIREQLLHGRAVTDGVRARLKSAFSGLRSCYMTIGSSTGIREENSTPKPPFRENGANRKHWIVVGARAVKDGPFIACL